MVAITHEVRLHDLTLRRHVGADGAPLGLEDRLEVLTALDDLGVDVAEIGVGADTSFVRAAAELGLRRTTPAAAASLRPAGADPAEDHGLHALLRAGTELVVVRVAAPTATATPDGAPLDTLTAVRDTVRTLRTQGRRVVLDAADYVEAFLADPVCAVELVGNAVAAGAEAVVLGDGGRALPDQLVDAVEATVAATGADVGVGIGDATGCAVAHSVLAAVAGASRLQVSARPGLADLALVAADLVRCDAPVRPEPDLRRLPEVRTRITTRLRGPSDPREPIVVPA